MIGVGTTIFLVNPTTFPSGTSYLLDTYSAAAAYSLRQLKTGVTSVVRVRRSSDNAESDFTATEITDGTLATWATGTDGFVVTWYDQSGNANDATQSTAGNQFQLVSTGAVITENGNPAIDTLSKLPMLLTSTINIATSWSVVKADAYNTIDYIYGNSNYGTFVGGSFGGVNGLGNNFGAVNSLSNETLTQRLDYISLRGVALYGETNGATEATIDSAGQSVYATSHIGGRPNGTTLVLNGKLQEYILFTSDESANRTSIESDINTHYSIY